MSVRRGANSACGVGSRLTPPRAALGSRLRIAARLELVGGAAAVFGIAASASNRWESILTFVLNAGWAWAAVLIVAGSASGRWYFAGPVAGIAASLGYYASDSLLRGEAFTLYLPELGYWCAAAVLLGPLLAAVGHTARRPDLLGLVAGLVLPAGAVIEMAYLPRWLHTDDPLLQQARIIVLVLASAGAIVWAVARVQSSSRRDAPSQAGT